MSHVWYAKYPEGVPHEINADAYRSIIDVFEQSVQHFADKPAYHCLGKSITFRELDVLSRNFAGYLQSIGLKPGDRVALQMPNILQYPVCMFGALRAGMVVVNTNPLYTPREMEHQFKDSGAKALVILENFAANYQQVQTHLDIPHVVITGMGDLLGGLKGWVVNFVVRNVKKLVPKYEVPRSVKLKDALAIGASANFQKYTPSDSNELAFIQYTGGTTGVSKGAMLTHRNIIANMEQMAVWMKPDPKDELIVITPLPLYHVYALTVSAMIFMKFGGLNVLIPNPRDMKAFMTEMTKWKFTAISGINTLFNGMMNHEMFGKLDWSHAKIVTAGGMALQRSVAERFEKLTGIKIVEGYGLSETSPVATMNPVTSGEVRIGTIGLPAPSTEIALRDPDTGAEVPVGERGEVCVRGPQVMKGYWNRDDETAKVMTPDGFFKTGDIGVMDPDGYFRIVDRIKDMINVSGLKVFPNEVEEVIAHHPGVLEVAAVGIPSEHSGEAVKVFVVKRDPNVTEEDIKAFAKERLVNYKRPHVVEFRTELPKSNVGKILRRPLREEELAKQKQTA